LGAAVVVTGRTDECSFTVERYGSPETSSRRGIRGGQHELLDRHRGVRLTCVQDRAGDQAHHDE